ncbi:MAG: lipoprotein [Alphaproteobacteria bacterium]|nr:lipoprotein [Alphaproteobacteria bacterium]
MKKTLSTLGVLALLTACQADIGSNQYGTSSVRQAAAASPCSVISVRQVNVKSDNNAGMILGALAGGVGGYAIGSGSTAHNLGAIGGAALGGYAGDKAQGALSSQTGYEYVVRLDNGQVMTLTQGTDVLLSPGQRCMILLGDPSRLIPY